MAGNLFISIDFGNNPSVDNGTRPYTGANPIWNSFSISLSGGPSATQTRVGVPTTVKVRVSNKGTQPVEDVNVDLYVMNPQVGAGTPSLAIRRLNGFSPAIAPGSGSTNPNDAHVVTCQIQDPVQGPIPWTPTAAELAATSGGHLCVIANAFADDDGARLPDAQPFDVANDPHQGQRNITLLAAAGGDVEVLDFEVLEAPEGEEATLAIELIEPELAIGFGERELLGSHDDIVVDDEYGTGLRGLAVVRDGERFPLSFSRERLRAKLFVDDEQIDRKGRLPRRRGTLPAKIFVELSRDEKIGGLHAFEIVQRDRRGTALGGALRMLTVISR
jgi:hypothetical protein